MKILSKTLALIFSIFFFIGFTWWDRSDMEIYAKIYFLLPAFVLLILAIVPYRLFSVNQLSKWGIVLLCIIGTIPVFDGMIEAWNSPIEPDTPAIFLRLIVIGVFILNLYLIWQNQSGKNNSDLGQ